MIINNDNTVADITFSGVDAFGNEKEFSCQMNFGLMLLPESTDFLDKDAVSKK